MAINSYIKITYPDFFMQSSSSGVEEGKDTYPKWSVFDDVRGSRDYLSIYLLSK